MTLTHRTASFICDNTVNLLVPDSRRIQFVNLLPETIRWLPRNHLSRRNDEKTDEEVKHIVPSPPRS